MNLVTEARSMFQQRSTLRALVRNHLVFSQALDRSIWGSVAEGDREELTRLVERAAQFPGPIVEIGTLFGFSTQLLADVKRAGQPLITVDNYSWNPFCMPPDHHREFTRSALHYCSQNSDLTIFDGTSSEFFESYRGPAPAMVFLDGSHAYDFVVEEIRHAKRLGSAIICGDDYDEAFPGVAQAVHEEFGDKVTVANSLWVATGELDR